MQNDHKVVALKWLLVALLTLIPVVLLAGVEVALRVFHYGYSTDYFIKSEDGRNFRANRQFGWQFFAHESAIIPRPVQFPVTKQPGTFRIFILGESAAAGSPNQSFGFGRVLEVMLKQQYPGKRFEVVNAAMRGINSRILLRIARECVGHQPDLFIIYMGNNEFVQYHTSETDLIQWTESLRLHRLVQWFRSTKLAQLTQNILLTHLQRSTPSKEVVWDMAFFRKRRLAPEDPRRTAIYDTFRKTFSEVCEVTTRSGTRVIVCSVGVNLKDCPPLASLHRAGRTEIEKSDWEASYLAGVKAEKELELETAIECYQRAERLDSTYAELHFRLAQCLLATGQISRALEFFSKARDCDALQFRADSRINTIIREQAQAQFGHNLDWVDVERALLQSDATEERVPGGKLFYDHVHFRFAADYEVAKTLFSTIAASLGSEVRPEQMASRQRCADLLGYTLWDELNLNRLMLELTSKPPFLDQLDHRLRQSSAERLWQQREQSLDKDAFASAIVTYRQALAVWPDDWQLHYNFGFLLLHLRDFTSAIEQFNRVLELFPKLVNVEVELGATHLQAGQVDLAVPHLIEATRIDPHYKHAWQVLAQAVRQQEGSSP